MFDVARKVSQVRSLPLLGLARAFSQRSLLNIEALILTNDFSSFRMLRRCVEVATFEGVALGLIVIMMGYHFGAWGFAITV